MCTRDEGAKVTSEVNETGGELRRGKHRRHHLLLIGCCRLEAADLTFSLPAQRKLLALDIDLSPVLSLTSPHLPLSNNLISSATSASLSTHLLITQLYTNSALLNSRQSLQISLATMSYGGGYGGSRGGGGGGGGGYSNGYDSGYGNGSQPRYDDRSTYSYG